MILRQRFRACLTTDPGPLSEGVGLTASHKLGCMRYANPPPTYCGWLHPGRCLACMPIVKDPSGGEHGMLLLPLTAVVRASSRHSWCCAARDPRASVPLRRVWCVQYFDDVTEVDKE